jgi:hypothetical protein
MTIAACALRALVARPPPLIVDVVFGASIRALPALAQSDARTQAIRQVVSFRRQFEQKESP